MKFELKTENENNTKLFSNFFKAVSILVLIIFLCDFAIKLGIITRQYQINYFCRLLSVEKNTSNFKKISRDLKKLFICILNTSINFGLFLFSQGILKD